MRRCPHCREPTQGSPRLERRRTDPGPGRKTTGTSLVRCPTCDRVIDGFSDH